MTLCFYCHKDSVEGELNAPRGAVCALCENSDEGDPNKSRGPLRYTTYYDIPLNNLPQATLSKLIAKWSDHT